MAGSRPSLDEASARRIGKSQLHDLFADLRARAEHSVNLPRKRLAWGRHVEAVCHSVMRGAVLLIQKDKRQLYCVAVQPYNERPGWLLIILFHFRFRSATETRFLASVSAHAVARLLERSRQTDVLSAVVQEMLPWSIEKLCDYQHGFLIVPTSTGHFTAEEDRELTGSPVFTTWLPDRLLAGSELAQLTRLRLDHALDTARSLSRLTR
jgi:hypothetical protein